jgi:hypothetical protein
VRPTAVALVQPGQWTIGALASNAWSFTGQDARPKVNTFLLQYFINYNLEGGWFLTTSPIVTSNWELPSDERWLVPFGGGVGRIFRIGDHSVQCSGSKLLQRDSSRRFSLSAVAAAHAIRFIVPEAKVVFSKQDRVQTNRT